MLAAFYSDSGERGAAWALLARAVEALYGIPRPEVLKDARGKPYFPARPDICFSLSHSRTHVMVCLGDGACGCDIETVRPLRPSVVRYVCSPEELEQFSFFELWTLKESYFKCLGALPHPFWQSRFSRRDGLILPPDLALRAALYPLGPCQAAVVSPLPPPAEVVFIPAGSLDGPFGLPGVPGNISPAEE